MIESEKEVGCFVKVERQPVGMQADTNCIQISAGCCSHLSDVLATEKEGSVVCKYEEFKGRPQFA